MHGALRTWISFVMDVWHALIDDLSASAFRYKSWLDRGALVLLYFIHSLPLIGFVLLLTAPGFVTGRVLRLSAERHKIPQRGAQIDLATPSTQISAALQRVRNDDAEELCPICMDSFTRPVKMRRCWHKFCDHCIRSLLAQIDICPACARKVFPLQDVVRTLPTRGKELKGVYGGICWAIPVFVWLARTFADPGIYALLPLPQPNLAQCQVLQVASCALLHVGMYTMPLAICDATVDVDPKWRILILLSFALASASHTAAMSLYIAPGLPEDNLSIDLLLFWTTFVMGWIIFD
jgi:hypothetical protein